MSESLESRLVNAVRTRRGISPKAATSHVHKNLVKHPRQRGWEPWQGYGLDSLEDFTGMVKAWLGDKSNLSGATLDAANYGELLEHFREMAGWKPPRKKAAKPKAAKKDYAGLRGLLQLDTGPEPKPQRGTVAAAAKRVPRVVTARIVPGNWRYMADHADTASARAWWSEYCDKRMRGEV